MFKIYNIDSPEKVRGILYKNFVEFSKIENHLRRIYLKVLKEKDKALIYYTQKYDKVKFKLSDIVVTDEEISSAEKNINKEFIKVFKNIRDRIFFYHKRIFENLKKVKLIFEEDGITTGEIITPIEKVGVYIPGGVANYPSSVFMAIIPAKVAGVKEIYVVTPPSIDGTANPYVLYCCKRLGVKKVFKVGGPWSIFALAFGTDIIPAVDKIIGPGNVYVTCAKKLVYGVVDVDCLAGPSEIAILADDTADPKFIASDLLSQAEHSKDAKIYLIVASCKDSYKLVEDVGEEIKRQCGSLSRQNFILPSIKEGKVFLTTDIHRAISIVNIISPEHLEIQCRNPKKIVKYIKSAGAIFLGKWSPVVVGDYIAGPSHIIPTSTTARFSSPLSVFDFLKRASVISFNKKALKKVEEEVKILSEVESLPAHYNSLKQRLI